jgi:hypothetical protein
LLGIYVAVSQQRRWGVSAFQSVKEAMKLKPSARLLKTLATASLPRDVVALPASTLMGYARIDYLARVGPLVTAMKFRRSPKPFEIGTQVLSWNDRYFYVRHTFRSMVGRDCLIATAYQTVSFSFHSETTSPAAMVRMATGEDVIPPLLDDAMRANFGLSALPKTLAPNTAH